MLSHAPENDERQDATAPCASLDTNEIPSMNNPTPWSIPTTPTIVVSDSVSSRVLHPAFLRYYYRKTPLILRICSDSTLDTPRSPSSTSSRIPLQVSPISIAEISTSIGALGPHDDIGGPNPSIPTTALPRSTQIAIPAHVVSNALSRPGKAP